MARDGKKTHDKILQVATKLFYSQGIRNVSVDTVAEKAGITKRSFYYHFTSKDDLITAYLEAKDLPNLAIYQQWFNSSARGNLATKTENLFKGAAEVAQHPKWRGCGFLRTLSELANKPGHRAIKVASIHKKRCETWLADELQQGGCRQPENLARQIMVLMDGAFSAAHMHRDPNYFYTAGKAAALLVVSASA